MPIIIESQQTSEYYTGSGKWSKDPKKGEAYKSRWAARAAAKQDDLHAFNIVLYFPLTSQMINLDHGK